MIGEALALTTRYRCNGAIRVIVAERHAVIVAEIKLGKVTVQVLYAHNIRMCARRLERRWGLNVDLVPHKTTLRIERPPDMSWQRFKDALRDVINPRLGAVLLFSKRTGNVFVCSNIGNQPGVFQRN